MALQHHEVLARVHWRGVDGFLGLSHVAAEAALAMHLGPLLWHELPSPVALALLQDAADRLCQAPANSAMDSLRFLPVRGGPAMVPPSGLCVVRLTLTLEGRGEGIALDWWVDPDAIGQEQRSFLQRQPAAVVRGRGLLADWGGLPIPLAFELGWVRLPLSELQSLRSEDVLLPDRWLGSDGSTRAVVRVGGQAGWRMGFMGELDETGRRIKVTGMKEMDRDLPEDIFTSRGLGAQDPMDHEPGGVAAEVPQDRSSHKAALDDIPVRLTFDLGERHLSLQELATIGSGHLFDLGLPLRGGVNLRVNGMCVGEGEIVDIDGRIGVAVTCILAART